ncbi:MAG TPA: methyltransferase domain-containing protein [Limnochordia bacterium]
MGRGGTGGRRRPAIDCYVATEWGLEDLAAREAGQYAARVECALPERVLLRGVREPRRLLACRLATDVFILLAELTDVTRSRHELGRLFDAITPARVEFAIAAWRDASPRATQRARVTYRVIARMEGRYNFLRTDLGTAVARALARRLPAAWRLVEDGADAEFWVELSGGRCVVGLRVSPQTMRHRPYKVRHIPASLRPAMAHAMVLLTRPASGDRFCDPMCGAGTLLRERAAAGPYGQLLGGDLNPRAVAAARHNVAGLPSVRIERWDATQLPLEAGSMTAMAVNPPYGRKLPAQIEQLYPALLREAARVLRAGSRLVVLSDQPWVVRRAAEPFGFCPEQSLRVRLRGHPAVICVFRRS